VGSLSEEEIRAEYVERMGEELGELQYLLWYDLTWLHLRWADYRELFGSDAQRIDLMNETAPAFFGHLNDVMWNDVVLDLCRLSDPADMGGKQNLTFFRLPHAVAQLPIESAISAGLEALQSSTAFARDWRNRRLAHRDWDHARDPSAIPLTGGSRASVEEALAAARRLMQISDEHFLNTTVFYEAPIPAVGGAHEMLYHLDSGLDAIRTRKAERNWQWKPKYL
jgi:HEPN superfamily AbiU2-like protein